MSELIAGIEGTPAGEQAALWLALMAAFLHALFGALQKGRFDPWISRAAIDICAGAMAAPVALFVAPWPEPHMWPVFAGMVMIHVCYKVLQAMTYQRGAFTVVYPVVRGSAPVFAVIGSGLLFGEHFSWGQWAGLGVLLAGIYGLAAYNLRTVTLERETMVPALALACATGAFVALYTNYDAWGIRATRDPLTFLAWFFLLDSLFMPLYTLRRWRNFPAQDVVPLLKKSVLGAFVAYFSFGAIMLATRLGHVGKAAVLRETSTVFAAAIGWVVLGEKVGPRRTALMMLIAAGAVIVELAGR